MLINATFTEKVTIKIGSHEIAKGLHLDNALSIDYHISEIYKKSSCNVCALSRVISGMSLSEKRNLMNALFKSQFNLFGCAIFARITTKSIDFVKGV